MLSTSDKIASYEFFGENSKDGKYYIDKDFFVNFFIKDSKVLEKPLTASAHKVGAYLLTVLTTTEYSRLPKRKEISIETGLTTKAVIDALNLLVDAKFLKRRDPNHNVNNPEILEENTLWSKPSNKNTPKYFDDFRINPFYNTSENESEHRITAHEVLNLMQKDKNFYRIVNYCINNPDFVSTTTKTILNHFIEIQKSQL